MPTVEIDGQLVEVEDGRTVIQAADRLGIEIPHYCWHPGLPVAGNCRMCLVEIEKSPKLQIACNTRVADGMVVHTKSERTRTAQQSVLEFLLINHPIDCPICDQAGECKLQEYYMDYDRQPSRVALPDKVRKRKAKPLGPLVILDQERCILCSRCVRFLDEVTHTSELAFYERGDHAELDLAPGRTLDNPYSGNVVDICPVGALTSRDFRFQARVWYLERTESVCAACANGCNINVYHREGRIHRFQPRENQEVNGYWMCDAGRLSHRDLAGESRQTLPLVREADRFAAASWEGALEAAVSGLRDAANVGIIVSARASNEEIHLLRRLAARLSGRVAGIAWSPSDATGDDFLVKADKNPNTAGLRLQGLSPDGDAEALLTAASRGELGALLVWRADLTTWCAEVARAALERVPWLVLADSDLVESAQYANVVLPLGTFAESEGTFTNAAGRVQRFQRAVPPPGEARPGGQVLAGLLGSLGDAAPGNAPAVFDALAADVPALGGLQWEGLGAGGLAVKRS